MEPIDNTRRLTGKIIHLSDSGWGFVTTPEIKFVRIFFHWTGLNPKTNFETLKKGMMIEFNVKEYEDKGLRAIKIEVLNENNLAI